MMWKKLLIAVLLIMALTTSRLNAAAPIGVSVEQSPGIGGAYLYTYTLTNPAGNEVSLISFDLSVAASSSLGNIVSPLGWDPDYVPGQALVSWTSSGPAADILPGSSGIFSFTSPLSGDLKEFQLITVDDFGAYQQSGQTVSPSASVPEPSFVPFVLLLAAALTANRLSSRCLRS